MVCDEVQKLLGDTSEQPEEKEEKKGNILQRFIKMLSDIFVPIIPAIVAGGLLMGCLLYTSNSVYPDPNRSPAIAFSHHLTFSFTHL